MYSWKLHEAIRKYTREVESETIKLIERGVPPYDAAEQAKRIVAVRRSGETTAYPMKQ